MTITQDLDLVLQIAEAGKCSVLTPLHTVFVVCPDGSILLAAGQPTGKERDDFQEFDLRSASFRDIKVFVEFILNPSVESDPLASELIQALPESVHNTLIDAAMRCVSSTLEPGHA
jgi:hypothetical protein